MDQPLVSVCIMTYNHAKYIREALDSVLMQKVDFSWEIIIADDYSTDGTREILLEYREKHPDLIRLLLQKKNIGPYNNWMDLLGASDAEYMAYLEGDDYWTNENKLQRQIEILRNDINISLVVHNVKEFDQLFGVFKTFNNGISRKISFLEILKKQSKFTGVSMVYRNVIKKINLDILTGEVFLQMALTTFGEIFYMAETMAVYRRHPGGITNTNKISDFALKSNLMSLKALKLINKLTNKKYKKHIHDVLGGHYRYNASIYLKRKEYLNAILAFCQGLYYTPIYIIKKVFK